MTSVLSLLFAFTISGANAGAQTSAPSCDAPEYHALDFWIGHWTVRDPNGRTVATSIVEPVASGCGVLELYSGEPGPRGFAYVGAGLHVFDGKRQAWRQLFADNRPQLTDLTGRQTSAGVVYEWRTPGPEGRDTSKRYTLSRNGEGVRQLGEQSVDEGKTWTTDFDLRYVKASA
jgi:hypothetical protein